MSYTEPTMYLGQLVIKLVRHVDPANPDPMTADWVDITPSYYSDDYSETEAAKKVRYQGIVDEILALWSIAGWELSSAYAEPANAVRGQFTAS